MRDREVKELEEEVHRLRRENELLRQKLDLLARRIFGRKSEELAPNQLEFLLGQLDEPEGSSASEEAASPEAETKSSRRTRRPRKPRLPEDLPVVETVLDPPPVTENPSLWRRIGEETSEQIDYEPGRFLVRRTVRGKWVRRRDPDAVPLTAPLPARLQERGLLAPGLLAHVLVSKYADHLPLYRQQKIFDERHGVWLPRQSLARGVELAADWLRPIAVEILNEQLTGGYVQIDETPVKYLDPGRGQTAQGYFWALHAPGGDTVYHWAPGRGHENLLKLLPETFTGTVQCDGYGAYRTMLKKRSGVALAGCWAHARRKFHDAFVQKEAREHNGWILHQIGLLYRIEERLRESRAGPRLRAAVRAAQSRPIIDRLRRLLQTLQTQYRPQSLTGKAISYSLGQWELLRVYLEDGRLEIDNNLVENAIRPTALGRKNWLFIGAEGAGWRSAVIFSIIQSCRNNGIEPFAYIRDVLERLPTMTNHQVPEITPRAWAQNRSQAIPKAS